MDIALLLLGFLLMLLGLVGSFIPVLPSVLSSWAGLFVLHLTGIIPMNWHFLGITLAITLFIWLLNYWVPAIGTKRFGGSKYGVYGTTIGLIVGLLLPIPLGFIIGAFFGAFFGELLFDAKDTRRAFKASLGALLGFLASAALEFMATFTFLILFLMKFWDYRADFF